VVAIDMALHAGLVDLSELEERVLLSAGRKGVSRLRQAVSLAECRSESPMETRLRLQIVRARLPHPVAQAELHDGKGRFLARADLYYPDVRLAVEYDGAQHKDQVASDLRRQNTLISAGYHVLRFTAADLSKPGLVAAQVRESRRALSRGHSPDYRPLAGDNTVR
jgi:very-short-patch-repair endonuclease